MGNPNTFNDLAHNQTTTAGGDPAGFVSHPDVFAHERNAGTSNQYGVGVDEANFTVINGVGAVAISAGAPVLLFAIHNTSAAAVVATIVGLLDENGSAAAAAATTWSIPANGSREFRGGKLGNTFTVAAATADVLVVEWRPQA